MKKRLRLGIIGGSFDPVHLGHLGIAEEAREAFRLDRVVFVPAAQPPHKGGRSLAPAKDRLRMVKLAIRDNPFFIASDIEMRRSGPSYTIDTLREMRKAHPRAALFFIVGADSLHDLHTWRSARDLVEEFEFIIIGRPGAKGPDYSMLKKSFGKARADRLRRNYIETEIFNISATDIRRRIKAGRSIRYLVPKEVERHIVRRGLYA